MKKFAYYIICFAGIGGILYGYDLGVIAGALLFIKKDIAMSDAQMSLIVGAVLGGGAVATLVSGILADLLGRRKMISIAAVIFVLGTLAVVIAKSFQMLVLGRVIQGVGVGIVSMIIPLYLTETTPAKVRGRGVAVFQLFLTIGILLAYVADLIFTPSGNWRAMLAGVGVPGIALFFGSLFIPESPSWLFAKGKLDKALDVLMLTRDEDEARKELESMKQLKDSDNKQNEKMSFVKLIQQRRYVLPLVLAFGVASLNQLTGTNSILQYSGLILKHSGLHSDMVSMVGSSSVGLINFLVTIVAISLVDKLGRRPLLVIGTSGIMVALVFCGLVSWFMPESPLKGYLIVGGMCLFFLCYGFGPGVVVWLAISELLPLKVRSGGMAVALFLNSMSSTVLAGVFLDISAVAGYGGVFILCAFFTLLYFLLAFFLIPETKNKSLEEIEASFRKD